MKPGQERIYYVIAESIAAARASPAIERLKERGIEVLLLAERIDEWVMGQVESFEGKRFKDATRGDLELGALASDADRKQHERRAQGEQGPAQAHQGRARRSRHRGACQRAPRRNPPHAWCSVSTICREPMRRILAAAGQKAPEVATACSR